MTVTEFKARCLKIISGVSVSEEPVLLTKRGKPVVIVSVPPKSEGSAWKLGQGADRAKIVGDIMAPIDVEWNAMASDNQIC